MLKYPHQTVDWEAAVDFSMEFSNDLITPFI